jgi:sugar lactone lactonase YvrE
MKLTMFAAVLVVGGVLIVLGQAQDQTKSGPGVQAPRDPGYAALIATCKTPPQARGGGASKGGAPKGGGAPQGKGPGGGAPAGPREYKVTEIPGVIAAGAQWKDAWTGTGNDADGIVATSDGGILLAQNDNSKVLKLDKNGKTTEVYTGLNTSGSVAMSSKGGALFVVNRGLHQSIMQLAPQKKTLADRFNGDPLDCAGGLLNDITADSKGGVYFTMGVVFHADAKGNVTRYGENINTNGIMLSADEKHLYVTNGGSLVAFDVQKDGSLTNQHEFAKWEGGGGDGSAFDAAGRFYVTSTAGIQVIGPDGKDLGVIPTPRPVITVTISGPDRKTLYAVNNDQRNDVIMTIPLIAQGPKGRGK